MTSFRAWIILLFISSCFVLNSRSDPVEGSRLLEEAFRDYDKRIRPNYGGSPLAVNVSVHILSISEIDTAAMTYTLTIFLRQIWTDPRLSFNSRRNIDTLTVLTLDALTSDRIWIPDTYFYNEIYAVDHDVLMKNQFCRISQDGLVLYSRRLTLTAFSPMSTDMFPYDSHKLNLELESYGSLMKDIKYQWAPEAISASSHNAPGFRVHGLAVKDATITTSTGSYSRLTIEIDVKRNPLPYELGFMLTTFILSLLCLASTSERVAPDNGVNASFLVMTLVAILYGILGLNGHEVMGVVACMTVLQLYILLCGGFCTACLVVNLRKRSTSHQQSTDAAESKREVISERCDGEELPVTDIRDGESLENKECPTDEEKKAWWKFLDSLRKSKSRMGTDAYVQWSLWIGFCCANVIFILFFRVLR